MIAILLLTGCKVDDVTIRLTDQSFSVNGFTLMSHHELMNISLDSLYHSKQTIFSPYSEMGISWDTTETLSIALPLFCRYETALNIFYSLYKEGVSHANLFVNDSFVSYVNLYSDTLTQREKGLVKLKTYSESGRVSIGRDDRYSYGFYPYIYHTYNNGRRESYSVYKRSDKTAPRLGWYVENSDEYLARARDSLLYLGGSLRDESYIAVSTKGPISFRQIKSTQEKIVQKPLTAEVLYLNRLLQLRRKYYESPDINKMIFTAPLFATMNDIIPYIKCAVQLGMTDIAFRQHSFNENFASVSIKDDPFKRVHTVKEAQQFEENRRKMEEMFPGKKKVNRTAKIEKNRKDTTKTNSTEIIGNRSRSNIMRTIRQNMASLKYAYSREKAKTPTLASGVITLKFAIDEFGKVIYCKSLSNTINSTELEKTVIEKCKRWSYGTINSPGDVTEVVYPFSFW